MDKFSSELKRILKKYPRARVSDLSQLMFHGTKSTKPEEIYASEYGLDNRFASQGMYGKGIYFANNANYSIVYQHRAEELIIDDSGQEKKMMVN